MVCMLEKMHHMYHIFILIVKKSIVLYCTHKVEFVFGQFDMCFPTSKTLKYEPMKCQCMSFAFGVTSPCPSHYHSLKNT